MFRSGIFTVAAAAAVLHWGCVGQPGTVAGQEVAPTLSSSSTIEPYQPRFDRPRPLVAVVGQNEHTELTDFVVPYGVLVASGEADVVAVATGPGPMEMFPALTFEPDATIAAFDRQYPEGADYVIVPAVHDAGDPALVDWIRKQEAAGATLVGVCDGVLVLAGAGVLEGRRATAHWYSMGGLSKAHPRTEWVRNRRYVADGNIVTTTGVSASIPVSLALVEAIAGTSRAAAVAASLGVDDWSATHDSEPYGLSAGHVFTAARNKLAFWRNEHLGIEVVPDVDEITLALLADLWSRTYRSRVISIAGTDAPVRTRSGLRVIPDRTPAASGEPDRMLDALDASATGAAIDIALEGIRDAYGKSTAGFVALQIEYPWGHEEGS